MAIKVQLQDAMKTAMRNKDKASLTTIRMMIDHIQKKEKDLLRDLSEEEVVQVLQTFKKQLEEELDGYLNIGNSLKFKEVYGQHRLVVSYLPEQMTEQEITHIIAGVIENILADGLVPNKGLVMKQVMPLVKGKADNKLVNQIVTSALQ